MFAAELISTPMVVPRWGGCSIAITAQWLQARRQSRPQCDYLQAIRAELPDEAFTSRI
jgi:hypothetical protein